MTSLGGIHSEAMNELTEIAPAFKKNLKEELTKMTGGQEVSTLLDETAMQEILETDFDAKLSLDDKVGVHTFEIDDVIYEWYDGNYYKKVLELKEGASFGELALKEEKGHGTRQATIKVEGDEPIHFATMTKNKYLQNLKRIDDRLANEQVEFLNNIPCFQTQSRKAMSLFVKYLKRVTKTRGETVYTQG